MHGVKRSYISSVEILDTIEEELRDNDSDNKGKSFTFFKITRLTVLSTFQNN